MLSGFCGPILSIFQLWCWVALLGVRIGEAGHPGPQVEQLDLNSEWFCIGVSNADSLVQRLDSVVNLPWGLWGFAETHMTSKQASFFAGQLRKKRRKLGEDAFVVTGSDIQNRPGSTEAGAWSGVAMLGHLPVRELHVPWPELQYSTGRVMIAACQFQGVTMVGGLIYGYARSQTHQHAEAMTSELLHTLTTEIILGRTGCRFIMGDMNASRHGHSLVALWHHYGWREVQEVAAELFDHEICMTCKGSTQQDQLWLSPEMIGALRKVEVSDTYFPSHAAVAAYFDFGQSTLEQQEWPMPAFVPWKEIDLEAWKTYCDGLPTWQWGANLTRDFGSWCRRFEDSMDGFVQGRNGSHLPRSCKGRGQRFEVERRLRVAPLAKPSRDGEVAMSNDFLGRQAQKWFAQVRRLQSMVHSLRAQKQTPNAQNYRAQLWGSVRRAKGFAGGFENWWRIRPIHLEGSPGEVQVNVPSLEVAQSYYQDFLRNYRSMEHHHHQARWQSLKAKLDTDENAIFRLLKKPMEAQLEVLEEDAEYLVEQVRPMFEVLIPQLTLKHQAICYLQEEQVKLTACEKGWFRVDGDVLLVPGQKLKVTNHVWQEPQIAERLITEWQPRWQRHQNLPMEHWDRVINFVAAFFPQLSLVAQPITRGRWRAALKGFKAKSARGPDALCRDDLLHMPDVMTDELLSMLERIEGGQAWPAQTMTAVVVLLKKHMAARLVGEFRPISLLSFLYRVWASIRTREMLMQLEPWMEHNSFGFLPHRGTLQYYYTIQVALETALQSGETLTGFVADVIKAFNYIPRPPVYAMATRAGIPINILLPWQTAHGQLARRFRVRHYTSKEVKSCTGLTEGDPLSCLGMVLCDFYFHLYHQRYLPDIHSFSYVDNLVLLSTSTPLLVQGTQVFAAWLETLDLQQDMKKTYTWSTNVQDRKTLLQAGFQIKHGARDLGAQFQYGLKKEVALRTERLNAVKPLWAVMARSSAAVGQKIKGVKIAIWPRVLHAASGIFVPETMLTTLRSGVMKGLRWQRAGASPLIRLGFLHDPCLDPDCYQWLHALRDLRQMVRKMEGMREVWNKFLRQFDGTHYSGPFSKLLSLCGQLGWAPGEDFTFHTTTGLKFLLASADWAELKLIFLDAWWEAQARKLHHRQDFAGLEGYNFDLTTDLAGIGNERHKALLQTCQDGTFFTEATRSHYDLTREGSCRYCAQKDTWEHRLESCPAHEGLRTQHGRLMRLWDDLPACLRYHGLVPRVPFQLQYWQHLQQIPDLTEEFQQLDQAVTEVVHLFVDGSCFNSSTPATSLAAWAVISGSQVLSSGPVWGLVQSSSRAELTAFLSSLKWAVQERKPTHVWTDSQYVLDGWHALTQEMLQEDQANFDLWSEVLHYRRFLQGTFEVHKIWSHQDMEEATSPFEQWWIQQNDRADRAAVGANHNRSEDFHRIWRNYNRAYALQKRTATDCQKYLLEVALHHETITAEEAHEQLPLSDLKPSREGEPNDHSFSESMSIPLAVPLALAKVAEIYGYEFCNSVLSWLVKCDGIAVEKVPCSYLELLVGWQQCTGHQLPIQEPNSKRWIPANQLLASTYVATLANQVALFRTVVLGLLGEVVDDVVLVKVKLTHCHILRPLQGIIFGVPGSVLENVDSFLAEMFVNRPLRRQVDMARTCRVDAVGALVELFRDLQ